MSATSAHLAAHLARLDLWLRREVLAVRAGSVTEVGSAYPGLVITEQEVDALLGASPAAPASTGDGGAVPAAVAEVERDLAAIEARLRAIERDACASGERLPLRCLADTLGLGELERDAVVIALAAEVDLRYERLFAYLQDDVTKTRPTLDLLFRLRRRAEARTVAARAAFRPGSPLLDWQLLADHDEPSARHPVLLARALKLDDHLVEYLLGSTAPDPRVATALVAAPPPPPTALPAACTDRLDRWAGAWRGQPAARPIVIIHGRPGTGRRAAAHHLAAALGRRLLLIDLDRFPRAEPELPGWLRLVEREARLSEAVLAWRQPDRLLRPTAANEGPRRAWLAALAAGGVPTLLLTERGWEPPPELSHRGCYALELPDTSYADRRRLWHRELAEVMPALADAHLDGLANRYRLMSGQVRRAAGLARELAWARDPATAGVVTLADVEQASRRQLQHRLGELAEPLTAPFDWADLVLPQPQLDLLRLIGASVRQREVVYGTWGLGAKLGHGQGIVALLAGPSGTGKTMAAQILARDLGLDLYRIDLASTVSKYIGETERNLEQIFAAAHHTAAILFFDEADALFGKRSEVRDAHDRYANIETAYLLQRLEAHAGLVILATNLKKNMDEAFVRRLQFTVDFPLPEAAERLEIWRRTLPPALPRAEPLDLEFLARRLRFSGGNIRNAVVTAAFLAADAGSPVGMAHLVRAAAFELQKLGKLVVESEFERYAEFVRA